MFSFFCLPLFCQDGALSLPEIDALIKQTDYDRALEALSSFIKKNPQKLDAAQKRIDAIMRARSYYTRLANDLLDVMEKEPENAEKKLAIIKELESLEKHPTQEHLAFIKSAKTAAEFTYYRVQFRNVIEEGAKNARAQKYADAISAVQAGFYMYRDDFYEENSAALTGMASRAAAALDAASKEYLDGRASWNDACRAFVQAVESGNCSASERAWENFKERTEAFAAARKGVVQAGADFERAFGLLKSENPDLTEASYLSFMNRFAVGIPSVKNSGILGVLDYEWSVIFEDCAAALHESAREKFAEAIKDAPLQNAMEGQFTADFSRLSDAERFCSLALALCDLDRLRTDAAGGESESAPLYERSMRAAARFSAGTKSSLENLKRFKDAGVRLDSAALASDPLQDARNGGAYQTELLLAIQSLGEAERSADEALNEEWFLSYKDGLEAQDARAAGKKEIGGEGFDKIFDFKNIMDFYEGVNGLCRSRALSKKEEAVRRLSDNARDVARLVLQNYREPYSEAEALLQSHYPDRALLLVQETRGGISSDKALLLSARANLESAGAGGAIEAIDGGVLSLDALDKSGSEIAARADSEILAARSAREEADEIYRRAERNFLAERFADARGDLQRARELYNESLGRQESESLRASSDKNLLDLGRRINEAENRIVVSEVRALKTRAKNEYYAGNFESAENILNRAESRWAVTNVEEDEEIKNLKLLVQNALSMKTGREIKPTAPLYPEMSQILSNARQYFDQGSRLMKSGRRTEALEILGEAKKKLQELQLVYPLNQEAALLTLRIDELADPAQFNESFFRRVEAARQSVRVASTQRQGYSDLLDLAQIRPNYPGLQKLIYDVEVEIGVRQKPVDQSALRRSSSLAQEAQRLYQSANGNEEILRASLSRLDEAIALNPNNESAITLKDRIQIAIGGKAAVVLSSADEASYNLAIQELRANNVVGAYTIVERLLQSPQNRRSSKILDLQKQVQARM